MRQLSVRFLTSISMAISLCLLGTTWAQTTIRVPADRPTIQAGIDAAANGDTVLVSPGVYTENIDFKGKAITVTSGATNPTAAASTIIQGAKAGSIATFQTNETLASVLNGFTLQKAFGTGSVYIRSNGIDILDTSPTVTNNTISDNIGCGIFLNGSASPLIQSNIISNNTAPLPSTPASLWCSGGTSSAPAGTGIAIASAGAPQVVNNIIENNLCDNGEPGAIVVCGVYITGGNEVLLKSNTIRNNIRNLYFGGATNYAIPTKLYLIQNLFYNNDGIDDITLQGVYTTTPSAPIMPTVVAINNTFYNANVDLQWEFQPSEADNNLFVQTYFGLNPSNPYGLLMCGTAPNFGGAPFITTKNNDLYAGGYPQPYYACPLTANNLASDPQFLDDSTSSIGAWNFRVQRTSPVIAAGDITAPMIPATDLDGKNRTVCGTIDIGVYEKHPIPPITLTSSPNPSVGGTSVTFQAHVQGNCNVPTGTLTILDGQTSIGTATLNTTGDATFSTAALFVGTHSITATYPGDFNFDPGTSNAVQQVVTGPPTTTSLQVVPNPAQAFQTINLTATVTSSFGVPNGTVSFLAGSQILTTVPLNGAGTAQATISTLGAGNYSITAVYNASVDYESSTSPVVVEVVNGATTVTALASAPNPSAFGQIVTFTATVTAPQSTGIPTGSVTFRDGSTILGPATLSATGVASLGVTSLSVGSHTITADYGGSTSDNPSTSNSIIQTVRPVQASITLTGTPIHADLGQTVTLTATITAVNGQPATGTIAFSDQFGTVGSATLSGGAATITTATLPVGVDSVTASYTGDTTFTSGTSNSVLIDVTAYDFTLTASPPSITVQTEHHASLGLTITAVGGFSGDVHLSCGALPAVATCEFANSTLKLNTNGTASTTLTLDTDAVRGYKSSLSGTPLQRSSAIRYVLALMLPVALFGLRRRRLHLRSLLSAMAAITIAMSFTGCSGKYPDHTPPGTYTIPITATGTANGAALPTTHTLNLTFVVTP